MCVCVYERSNSVGIDMHMPNPLAVQMGTCPFERILNFRMQTDNVRDIQHDDDKHALGHIGEYCEFCVVGLLAREMGDTVFFP